MATLDHLLASNELDEYEPDLEDDELADARILLCRHAKNWLEQTLPGLPATSSGGKLTPQQQVDNLFYRFVTCKPLGHPTDFRLMHPHPENIWEFRTDAVRVFGWFHTPTIFVAVNAGTSDAVHDMGAHHGYLNEVKYWRNTLALDEPKSCALKDIADFWRIEVPNED